MSTYVVCTVSAFVMINRDLDVKVENVRLNLSWY